MNHKSLTTAILTLGLALTSPSVLARPGGGGRAPGGAAGGMQTRQGSFTGPQGRTTQTQGQSTSNRDQGSFQHQYEGTRTGPNGQTSTVERQTNVQKTGDNTWHRDSSQSVTGPQGQTRTSSQSGDATVTKKDNGYTKTYEGTATNAKGQTVDVNREVDVTRNADGTVTRERSSEVTSPTGTVLHSGESTTTITPGQGSTTTGSRTNQNGDTWNYEASQTKTGPGSWSGERTVTGPQGKTSTAKWQKIGDRWVKIDAPAGPTLADPPPETPTLADPPPDATTPNP